jgi:predicted nucleic acid-binding protein
VTAFIDTNVIIRHLTGEPPAQAAGATTWLRDHDRILLAHLIVAEVVYVLESFYEVPRPQVADNVRALVTLPNVVTTDQAVLLRTIEVYEDDRLDFAEAFLVACAESTGIGVISSFDRAIDRVRTVARIEPS